MAADTKILLQSLSHAIIQHIRSLEVGAFWNMVDLYEADRFGKVHMPEADLIKLLAPYKLKPTEVQIEIGQVTASLIHEPRRYQKAAMFCIVLGKGDNAPNPRLAKYRVGNEEWFDAEVGTEIWIPAGVEHAFTVDIPERGKMWFLSVQIPPEPRGDGDGHDGERCALPIAA